ncbi:hypothetical protein TPHA_0B00650 [Tetrapisispora phaffii CBS 4417]|uniref:NTF2 domain-containing protein n=1 Tax=Tetrapisispora phaffii (strain ATCC 24235 / CBS 4417 / NBRC 1672 / NRRL Y-8282 / UCD 70-5) TaxID=1071381 RepID=G8BQE0_TETPH|nr:hypothetical protein TPHA_0B00650 [Tetrapisispora phaffii CBS 4417]CCE61737.1 hypothetical protein TPHA_0B00650 [Tetrapisispora phaffii CBS 4417]
MSSNQSGIIQTFVKKILAHLDDADPQRLNSFLSLFNQTGNCKIILNGNPIAQPTEFLTAWQQQVVQSQHNLTSLDYHIIPGSGTLICDVGCKIRFDESGRNKLDQDAVVNPTNTGTTSNAGGIKGRPFWGPFHGVSIQLIMDDRIFKNDQNGVITAINYNIIYKPDDSLINLE